MYLRLKTSIVTAKESRQTGCERISGKLSSPCFFIGLLGLLKFHIIQLNKLLDIVNIDNCPCNS